MRKLMLLPLLLIAVNIFAQMDGPAALPAALPSVTAVSLNAPKLVPAGSNLQAAINAAVCGDNLQLDPAGVWNGPITINPAGCDANHWLTITSSAPVSLSPTTGRVIPGQQLPKLVMVQSNDRVNYGSFVNIAGIEITRAPGNVVYNLMLAVPGAHDFILNMVYVHGNAEDETTRGISLSNSTRVAILNSWFADFHCRAVSGACGDSQAITGGTTTIGDEGVFLVENNELQAATENMLFGGGTAIVVPHDITVIGNHFFKPLSWNPADPSYAPTAGVDGVLRPWAEKNCFELKNANRVLYDGNVCENVWGGFTQIGFALLITPKNPGTCPICAVTNVTVRNSRFYHTALALQIGYGPSDNGAWPAAGYGYSLHDLVFDNLNSPDLYFPGHWLVQLSGGLSPSGQVMHDVTLQHLTLNVPKWHGKDNASDGAGHGFLTVGGPLSPTMYNIHVDNNVFPSGNSPIISTGGGAANCAYTVQGNGSLLVPTCWSGSFSNNVIISNDPLEKYPATTIVTTSGANPDVIP